MGAGIAQFCAIASYQVVLMDISEEQLRRGMKSIEQSLSKFAEQQKITETVPDILRRIPASQSVEA